jgi:hypothetical protein
VFVHGLYLDFVHGVVLRFLLLLCLLLTQTRKQVQAPHSAFAGDGVSIAASVTLDRAELLLSESSVCFPRKDRLTWCFVCPGWWCCYQQLQF